jgi:cysteine-rich repeat protein
MRRPLFCLLALITLAPGCLLLTGGFSLGRCGDGILLTPDEECDDGNAAARDGCDPGCRLEAEFCGDGATQAPEEECDDGNTAGGDGCASDCTIEEEAPPPPPPAGPTCGDGTIDDGEECDDGNTEDGDGCDSDCQDEGGGGCSLVR